jgi:hypothetical protein
LFFHSQDSLKISFVERLQIRPSFVLYLTTFSVGRKPHHIRKYLNFKHLKQAPAVTPASPRLDKKKKTVDMQSG